MRKLLLLLTGVVCMAVQAFAQRTVTGKVTNENGVVLSNVSVLVKGTTTGTTSKSDGTFSLVVPSTARSLIFSSVDMTTVEMAIPSDNSIDIVLKSEEKIMSEVVVTGYGTQRRGEVTGSISNVKGSAIANKPIQSFEQALAGRATGVQITVPNGVLNTPPVFRIRGTNSISLSSYPLIVVDGVPMPTGDFSSTSAGGNALASINPNDIENIDIAKDAAATAIYGSRAANGVVFITTKKGRSGKPRVSYNGSVSWTDVFGVPPILNAQEYTDYKNMAAANNPGVNSTNPAGAGYIKFNTATDANGNLIDTYWPDLAYRTGFSHEHNLNVSGGNDNTTYYFSTGYTHQEGIIRKNDFIRKNILFNLDSRLNNVLTVGGKIAYSNELNRAASSSGSLPGEAFATAGLGRLVLVNAPNVGAYTNTGAYNINSNNIIGPMNNSMAQVGFWNPVTLLDLDRSNSETNHMQGNVYLQLKPFKWMTLKTLYGVDNLIVDNDVFWNPLHGNGRVANGQAFATIGKSKRWTWANTAQFDQQFGGSHNVSALVGTEQDRRTFEGFGLNRQTLSDPTYTVIQAGWVTPNTSGLGIGENYLVSAFGRLNYDFKKKYFLTANLRKDEYSAFADKKALFWGVSAGWELSKEEFFTNSLGNVISNFKIRASYGKVGNIGGIGDFVTYSSYGSGLYGGSPTLIFNQAGNDKLEWETSKKFDLGFTMGLLKDRLNLEFSYYKNNISGLILFVTQAPSTGVPNAIPENVGTMYNKGFELNINGSPIRGKNFSWNSMLNVTTNKNEVTALAPGLTQILTSTSGLEIVHRTAVGFPVGTLWLVRNGGVDPATGRRILLNQAGQPVHYSFYQNVAAGIFSWVNPDGTRYSEPGQPVGIGVTQAKDGVMFGNTNPKVFGGWDNTFSFKGFELNVLLTYQFGFYIYYGTNAGLHDQRFWNNHRDVLTAWQKPGDVTTVPKPIYLDNVSNGSGLPMSYNAFKGDFVKLKNLTLAYNVPANILGKIKTQNARIYVSGQNLAIFTDYPGPDPEVSSNGNGATNQGADRNTVANGRTIVVGINIGF